MLSKVSDSQEHEMSAFIPVMEFSRFTEVRRPDIAATYSWLVPLVLFECLESFRIAIPSVLQMALDSWEELRYCLTESTWLDLKVTNDDWKSSIYSILFLSFLTGMNTTLDDTTKPVKN